MFLLRVCLGVSGKAQERDGLESRVMETPVQPRGWDVSMGTSTGEKLRQQQGALWQVQHPLPSCRAHLGHLPKVTRVSQSHH